MLQDLGSRVDELYTKLSIFGLYTNNQYIIIFNILINFPHILFLKKKKKIPPYPRWEIKNKNIIYSCPNY